MDKQPLIYRFFHKTEEVNPSKPTKIRNTTSSTESSKEDVLPVYAKYEEQLLKKLEELGFDPEKCRTEFRRYYTTNKFHDFSSKPNDSHFDWTESIEHDEEIEHNEEVDFSTEKFEKTTVKIKNRKSVFNDFTRLVSRHSVLISIGGILVYGASILLEHHLPYI